MWSWKNLFGSRCFSSPGYKDCFTDTRLPVDSSSIQIDGKQKIFRVVKTFVLVCYCLALNVFMAYVMRIGANSLSYGVVTVLLVSFVYFIHLYKCEKVDVDNGNMRTIRSFFYVLSIFYIMVMLMCFCSLLISSERKSLNT